MYANGTVTVYPFPCMDRAPDSFSDAPSGIAGYVKRVSMSLLLWTWILTMVRGYSVLCTTRESVSNVGCKGYVAFGCKEGSPNG